MAERNPELPSGKRADNRRIIRVEGVPDQAHIAALLRRAFAVGREIEEKTDSDFADLLARIH